MEKKIIPYNEYKKQREEEIRERFLLVKERVKMMIKETCPDSEVEQYFHDIALFLTRLYQVEEWVSKGQYATFSLEKKKEINGRLYQDILPKHYDISYGNPEYCEKKLGGRRGQLLCFLYGELRSLIPDAFHKNRYDITIYSELFLEIWCLLKDGEGSEDGIYQAIYWFEKDYSEVLLKDKVYEQLEPGCKEMTGILMEKDLTKLDYLYEYGEYISENECQLVTFLNTLPESTIEQIASTFVTGYIDGFKITNVDLSKKENVNLRYGIGFERIIKKAAELFLQKGLVPVIYSTSSKSIRRNKVGVYGTSPNKQYEYDHRFDEGVYLDKGICERKMEVYRQVFLEVKKQAALYAGPAVLEVFGEVPFTPAKNPYAIAYTKEQQKLAVAFTNEYSKLFQEYVPGNEVSFTIMALPVPEIGTQFDKIFKRTIEINTLDNEKWRNIQQSIIDAMDEGDYIHVLGTNGNATDLTVALWTLKNKEKETKFENCVADVNIPLGEVFTSPVLKGTNGVLAVSKVFLNDLRYDGLQLTFTDGMVTEYTCKNFEKEEENQAFIKENLLMHRETLPMGEFAIGTNTIAYEMAQEFDILHKLPILIVEKMGPHFAIGDTCYSHSEDTRVYNPDGKEIVAKENECSKKRENDIDNAYFNCHTDITIPYNEIGSICVCKGEKKVDIIKDGQFVLSGTMELNEPLKRLEKMKRELEEM